MGIVIGYVSDLHLEVDPQTAYDRLNKISDHMRGFDVVVIAGDFSSNYPSISRGKVELTPIATRMNYFCGHLGDQTQVLYVPGNHEYYRSSFKVVDSLLKKMTENTKNLHVLNNDVITIKNQRFIGTTLWFNHRSYDVDLRLNDFRQIENFTFEVEKRAQDASNFLTNELQEGDVMITHHLPTWNCVSGRYTDNTINRFYVHNHAPLLAEVPPKLCIHGHSHDSWDAVDGITRYLRNPYGYAMHEENPEFDFGAFVEV